MSNQTVFTGPAYFHVDHQHEIIDTPAQRLRELLKKEGVEVLQPVPAIGKISASFRPTKDRVVMAHQFHIHNSEALPALAGIIAKCGKRIHFLEMNVPKTSVDRAMLMSSGGVLLRYILAYIMGTDEMASRLDVLIIPVEPDEEVVHVGNAA